MRIAEHTTRSPAWSKQWLWETTHRVLFGFYALFGVAGLCSAVRHWPVADAVVSSDFVAGVPLAELNHYGSLIFSVVLLGYAATLISYMWRPTASLSVALALAVTIIGATLVGAASRFVASLGPTSLADWAQLLAVNLLPAAWITADTHRQHHQQPDDEHRPSTAGDTASSHDHVQREDLQRALDRASH